MVAFSAQGRWGALLGMCYGKLHSFFMESRNNIIRRFSITLNGCDQPNHIFSKSAPLGPSGFSWAERGHMCWGTGGVAGTGFERGKRGGGGLGT